jgi:prepilin-type N-terminal cleavage/methylation domain-containing protein
MNNKQNLFKPMTSALQRGLTLIELAVVLAILVALSTLMIPYVGNYIGKAEVATSNYNSTALLGALQQYYALNQAYPNKLDLLSSVGTPGDVVKYLDDTAQVKRPGYVSTAGGNVLTYATNFGTMPDNGAMAASMAKVGVTRYFYLRPGTPTQDPASGEWYIKEDSTGLRFDATYGSQDVSQAGLGTDGFGQNGERILSTGVNGTQIPVMWVSDNCGGWWKTGHPECLANIMGYRNCKIDFNGDCPLVPAIMPGGQTQNISQSGTHMLILLGINQNNDMIGKTLTTAPVHFPENKTTNPSLVYSRFLAVFDVDMRPDCWLDSVGCDAAKLVGVVVGPDATRGWQTATTGMARAFKPAE